MSSYVVVSDNHSGASACIDAVASVLSKAGHDVDKGGVDSNSEAYIRAHGKGKISIFIVNGVCLSTFNSHVDVVKSGLTDKVIFAFPKTLMGGSSFNSEETLSSLKMRVADDAHGFSKSRDYEMSGKYTPVEYFEKFSQYVNYVWADDCEKVGEAILNGNFGSSSGGGSETSSGESETKPMSGWESLLDLIKPYDGEIFLLVRGDTVVCKRIEIPTWSAIWAYEGVNIVDDSVTVTDYSPEIYNTLEVQYGSEFQNSITLYFNKHIELFGERKKTIQATKKVSQDEYDEYMKWLDEQKGTVEQPQSSSENKTTKYIRDKGKEAAKKQQEITKEELNSDYESPMDKLLYSVFGIEQPNQRNK